MSSAPAAELALAARFGAVRQFTEQLCAPLEAEDYVVQSMPDASPAKWHLAHTSWFFETFVLEASVPDYQPVHPQFRVLFNSYYETVGPQFTRAERGMLTRPTVAEVYEYRHRIDEAVLTLLQADDERARQMSERIELGLMHEQQHQELLLTDLQHAFSKNPLSPVYRPRLTLAAAQAEQRFVAFAGGIEHIGHDGAGFAFDNERPRHRVIVEPFEIGSRLVTAGEYIEFIQDGGYSRPELWLSDGFAFVHSAGISAPLYWSERDGEYRRYSLHGEVAVERDAPLCHVSFYEADAFARWAGARLPSEAEWELAYGGEQRVAVAEHAHFVEDGGLLPRHTASGFGSTWVWTSSPYTAYPGFRAAAGALGEYNGKFMCNQIVLRGGSCFSARTHLRATYRNFFPPAARWQVSGVRLARSV
jgi:ergothioneine biosynthesis protein EgtB